MTPRPGPHRRRFECCFELWYKAALVEQSRQRHAAAAARFRTLSKSLATHPQAPKRTWPPPGTLRSSSRTMPPPPPNTLRFFASIWRSGRATSRCPGPPVARPAAGEPGPVGRSRRRLCAVPAASSEHFAAIDGGLARAVVRQLLIWTSRGRRPAVAEPANLAVQRLKQSIATPDRRCLDRCRPRGGPGCRRTDADLAIRSSPPGRAIVDQACKLARGSGRLEDRRPANSSSRLEGSRLRPEEARPCCARSGRFAKPENGRAVRPGTRPPGSRDEARAQIAELELAAAEARACAVTADARGAAVSTAEAERWPPPVAARRPWRLPETGRRQPRQRYSCKRDMRRSCSRATTSRRSTRRWPSGGSSPAEQAADRPLVSGEVLGVATRSSSWGTKPARRRSCDSRRSKRRPVWRERRGRRSLRPCSSNANGDSNRGQTARDRRACPAELTGWLPPPVPRGGASRQVGNLLLVPPPGVLAAGFWAHCRGGRWP